MRKGYVLLTLVLGLVLGLGMTAGAQITQVTSASTTLAENNAHTVAKDELGNYYVAFISGSSVYVRKSEDGGQTWRYWNGSDFDISGSEVSLGNSPVSTSVATDSSNNLHLIYNSNIGGQLYYRKFTVSTKSWSSATMLDSSSSSSAIAVDSSNNIHVVWNTWYNGIKYSKYSAGSWSSNVDIVTGSGNHYNPSLAVDSTGNVHVVWTNGTGDMFYAKGSGGTWSSPVKITSGSYPSIAVDSTNNIHVVFGIGTVYYLNCSGGTWSSPVKISDSYTSNYPSIGIDGSGNLNVVWYGYSPASTTNYQIRYIKYSGGKWSGPVDITSGSFSQTHVNISKDGSAIVWQGTTDSAGISSSGSNTGLMFGDSAALSRALSYYPSTPLVEDAADNGDARDIKVTFAGSVDETNVQEYRIIVVPSTSVSSFTDSTAAGLAASRYQIEPKSGNGANHSLTLSQVLQDSNGKSIVNGIPYRVFIYTVGQNGQISKLIFPSDYLTLSSPPWGTSISKILPITASLPYNNTRAIAKDGLGNYYVTFGESGSSYVYIRKSDDGGQTWKYWNGSGFGMSGPDVALMNTYASPAQVSIAVDGNNNLHLVARASGDIYYIKYDLLTYTWTNIIGLSGYSSNNPAIAIDSSNNIHVVWAGKSAASSTYNQIRYTKYDGTSWSSVVDVTSGSSDQRSPSIAVDGFGNVHVVWYDGGSKIWYAKYSSGSWTGPVNIASGSCPSIAVDSSNNIHVVYGWSSIYYLNYSGGAWSSPTKLSGIYSSFYPSIGADGSGNLNVVWYGNSAASIMKHQILYTKYSGGAWTSPVDITSGSFNQEYVNISKDGSAFVWEGTTNGNGVSSADYNTGLMFYISVIPTPIPGTPSATDIANNGDGRDIQVTFTGAVDELNISGYKIFVVKSTDAPSFGSSAASGLASSRYTAVAVTTAGASHTVTLTQTLLDSSGAVIKNGVAYKIFVLSVGKTGYSDTLSSGSSSLTLAMTIQGITTMTDAVKDLANNGDGRDIRVMFKGSPNEAGIQSYRIIVVRMAITGAFDAAAAFGIPQASYIAEPVKGNGRMHLFYLTQSLQDSEGNPITGGVPYSAYVLAVGKTGFSNALTSLGDVTLNTNNEGYKVEAPTPNAADIANNGNGMDLRVTFKKPKSEVNIAFYRIIVSTVDLTPATAGSVLAAGYKQITPTATGVGYTVSMGAVQTESDGTTVIKNNTAYKAYILIIGKNGYDNVLSTPSKSITLSPTVPSASPIRGFSAVKVGSGHTGSNISVTFNEPLSVSNVQEYRIFISTGAGSLNLTTANGISDTTKYIKVDSTGKGAAHTVTLTGLPIYDGTALVAGDYKVYVLTVGKTSQYANKLTGPSGVVKLD